jgi:hypothetical protein
LYIGVAVVVSPQNNDVITMVGIALILGAVNNLRLLACSDQILSALLM